MCIHHTWDIHSYLFRWIPLSCKTVGSTAAGFIISPSTQLLDSDTTSKKRCNTGMNAPWHVFLCCSLPLCAGDYSMVFGLHPSHGNNSLSLSQPLCLIQLSAKLHTFAIFCERYLIFSSSFRMNNGNLLSWEVLICIQSCGLSSSIILISHLHSTFHLKNVKHFIIVKWLQ